MSEQGEKKIFQNNNHFFQGNTFRYTYRILILYIFSTIFKSFDMSFKDFGIFDTRGHVFSLLYVIYGLIVWEGGVKLLDYVEQHITTTSKKLLSIVVALLIYGLIVAFVFGAWYAATDIWLFNEYEAWNSFTAVSYDMNFGIFLFYSMILAFNGIGYYYKAWQEYRLQTERLMRENIQAKYDALRNQIEPHFFFNSLSVLTNLVYQSPDLSAEYITQLAKTYRYILDKKFENLVPLQTELDFLDSYLFLIRIRHGESVLFQSDIDTKTLSDGMIPPATLQMLIENSIKHNRFSANEPLTITVTTESRHLVVTNDYRKKQNSEHSSGIGLENIRKRYELTGAGELIIIKTENLFIVKIPIIKGHESHNI